MFIHTILWSAPYGDFPHSLHPLVIIPTFLFPLYFIRRERFVTGRFLYIYTMHKGRKTGDGKGVCTRVANRVHTVGGVSSDTVLYSVHTPNRGCAHGQEGMWLKTGEMYIYTITLYIYTKLAARESRIWAQVFFWTKIGENFNRVVNDWCSTLGWSNLSLGLRLA